MGDAAKLGGVMFDSMTEETKPVDKADTALNVAVRGDKILILGPAGVDLVLSVRDARRSLQRLADAIAVAEGRSPFEQ